MGFESVLLRWSPNILLADDAGKAVGKLIRQRLLPHAVAISVNTQFGGGFNGGETAFAHLYLRLLIDAAACTSISCSIIFLDVVAAFAQMLRRIVFIRRCKDLNLELTLI